MQLDQLKRREFITLLGAYRYLGMAGYSASALDLFRAHGVSSIRAFAKIEFGRRRAGTRGCPNGPCCLGVCLDGVFDLLSHPFTPLNVDHVRGVQGRYFVIALPIAAIFIASAINMDLPR